VAASFGCRASKGLTLLESLYFRPIISVQAAAEMTHLTYRNANRLVEQFPKAGLLKETTGRRRHRRFRYASYLALFLDAEEVGR